LLTKWPKTAGTLTCHYKSNRLYESEAGERKIHCIYWTFTNTYLSRNILY